MMKKAFSFWGPMRCELMDVACSESSVIPLGYSCAPGFRILKEIFESGWFSDVCERDRDGHSYPTELGLSKAVVPKLLRLSWMGYPLHRHKDEKWGYLVPFRKQGSLLKNGFCSNRVCRT